MALRPWLTRLLGGCDLLATAAALAVIAAAFSAEGGRATKRPGANHAAPAPAPAGDPVEAVQAAVRTDAGTEIRIVITPPEETSDAAGEVAMLERFQLRHRVIRTAPADASYSCHGWVFTAVPCHLSGGDVEVILRENGYREVAAPRAGDLVVYRDAGGAVAHTGVVRVAGPDGLVLVESKWGARGRYLHRPEGCCYGGRIAYYRGKRADHRLKVVTSVGLTAHLRTSPNVTDDGISCVR